MSYLHLVIWKRKSWSQPISRLNWTFQLVTMMKIFHQAAMTKIEQYFLDLLKDTRCLPKNIFETKLKAKVLEDIIKTQMNTMKSQLQNKNQRIPFPLYQKCKAKIKSRNFPSPPQKLKDNNVKLESLHMKLNYPTHQKIQPSPIKKVMTQMETLKKTSIQLKHIPILSD